MSTGISVKKLGSRFILKLFLFVTLNCCAICIAIFIYVKWAEYTGHNVVRALDDNKIMQKIFLKDEYLELERIIMKGRNKTFSAIQDFDNEVALSKDMYNSQEMFGVTKYKYRPNIGIYDIRLWTGLRFKRLCLAASPQIKNVLNKNKLLNNIYFETDSFGFKKTEFTWTPNSCTIFFLGDSFTEGLWVESKKTFVNQLGVKLKRTIPTITPINLGVDGYSALEEDWMLEKYAPILHPKIVVTNLFPNDVDFDYIKVLQGKDIPESNYAEMFYYLQRMKDFCEQEDITLVISVVPAKEQFNELRGFSVFNRRVEEWCKRQGILCLDARDYFDKTEIETDYFYWDPHFSEQGHAIYAEFLSHHLAPLIISKDKTHA